MYILFSVAFKNPNIHIDTTFENLTPKTNYGVHLGGIIRVQTHKIRGIFWICWNFLAPHDVNYGKFVPENVSHYAKYIASCTQKEILHVFTQKVRNEIHKENGDLKFCIMTDECWDISKNE